MAGYPVAGYPANSVSGATLANTFKKSCAYFFCLTSYYPYVFIPRILCEPGGRVGRVGGGQGLALHRRRLQPGPGQRVPPATGPQHSRGNF